MSEPKEDVAAILKEAKERREKIQRNPTLCSNCLNGGGKGSMFVEEANGEGRVLLCSLRCLAIWAMTRGWKR